MTDGNRAREALAVRQYVIDRLRAELVGPDPGLPAVQTGSADPLLRNEEILRQEDPPRVRYGAGVLFPRQTEVEEQQSADAPESTGAPDEADGGPAVGDDAPAPVDAGREIRYRGGGSEAETEQEINRANEYLPSALGLTALVRLPDRLRIEIDAGRYGPETLIGQPTWKDEYVGWRRIPIRYEVELTRDELESGPVLEREIETGSDQVSMRLHLYIRGPGLQGSANDARMITFTLLNSTTGAERRNQECLFQTRLSVQDAEGSACFLEYPDRAQRLEQDDALDSDLMRLSQEEQDSMRLLYRKRRVFAVGHGCAPDWSDTEADSTDRVWTEAVPTFEVPPVLPAELDQLELRMEPLSDEDSPVAIDAGEALCGTYSRWIDDLEEVVDAGNEIQPDLVPAAERHIENARQCLDRMKDGVELLKKRADVRRAFALMNRAMLMQQVHYRISSEAPRQWVSEGRNLVLSRPFSAPTYEGRGNRWRPFQLAFVLMNLRSIVDPSSSDRETVDVIWFPTGGGKTEAYLGLAAFTILFRRITDPAAAGTVVLTRYTLRLLTTQQYQRAASLICALEYLRRRRPGELGSAPVTIGLWVGSGVTPNREQQAAEAFQRMLREGGRENMFALLSCPWCGAGMGAYQVGRNSYKIAGYRQLHAPRRVRHICDDPSCEFNEEGGGLPVLVTDEAIYAEPPAMVVGTVDKFALLPWYPEASSLFGIVTGERQYRPPELIIQDELHLISGPLGSMVGHYESVIGELCRSPDGLPVKIVASTATIARASEQVRALYARDDSFLFPPQGLEWGSSFFAEERRDLAGRTYVGVFATALPSQQTAMIRVMSSLLQAPALAPETDPAVIDPYWSLIAYFNSIRELGSAATLVSADIQEYIRVLHRRLGLTPEWPGDDERRWVRRPTLELTSRVSSGEISSALAQLFDSYDGNPGSAVDVCLATNMIQVGLDVQRLGLMAVAGQPKTTSEYIQATSRVGRSIHGPGLVVVLLNPSKPRDRSHYEHFRAYHERIYSWVEPTSVTPFAIPVRERALHALVVTLARYWGDSGIRERPDPPPNPELAGRIREAILDRVARVDPSERPSTEAMLDRILSRWRTVPPSKYGGFGPPDEQVPLMYPDGSEPPARWEARNRRPPWPTPSSMRNVDATCELQVVADYPAAISEGEH